MSYVLTSNQTGGLPITVPFQVPLSGDVTIAFSGTAWTQTSNTVIGIDVLLDGVLLGRSLIYSNNASEHRALPTMFFATTLSEGPHKLTFVPTNGNTVSDVNDFYSAWIID